MIFIVQEVQIGPFRIVNAVSSTSDNIKRSSTLNANRDRSCWIAMTIIVFLIIIRIMIRDQKYLNVESNNNNEEETYGSNSSIPYNHPFTSTMTI
jgi:hypothetical protein